MAGVIVDTEFPDSAEAQEFAELLDEDDRSCWYLVRLWLWGIETNRVDGKIPAAMARVPARVSARIQYSGDPQILWQALTTPVGPEAKPWLVEQDDGSYYMRGWSRQKRFFREKARLRKVAEDRRKQRDMRRDEEDQIATEGDGTRVGTQKSTRVGTRVPRSPARGNQSQSTYQSSDREREPDDLDLDQLNQQGFERFGQLGGSCIARLSKFTPVKTWEFEAVLATKGKTWAYVCKVLESIREENAKPDQPPAGAKPVRKNPGWDPSDEELRAEAKMMAKKIEAEDKRKAAEKERRAEEERQQRVAQKAAQEA